VDILLEEEFSGGGWSHCCLKRKQKTGDPLKKEETFWGELGMAVE
jgi:hypothetical protein